jgi:hypothetical protein
MWRGTKILITKPLPDDRIFRPRDTANSEKVKAALGQGRRFGWIRFRRPEYGETVHVSEMDAESGALCRCFLRPSHPR